MPLLFRLLPALALGAGTVPFFATAQPVAPARVAPITKEETIQLTPFEVAADSSDTYQATNTNSVTGTNTPLSKTPLDAKVFNREFLDELGVIDMTEMLWRHGGLGPATINTGEDVRGMIDGDRQDPKSMTMRGLSINNPRRDGFLRSDTTLLDSFDIERVEALGGSNSLLFGSGDAGGVITSASKRAYLRRRPTASIAAMVDSEGSRRYTIDGQAGGEMFALRVNAVKSDILNFRPGLAQHADGAHVALTFQPWKRLQIRGEYRHYTRDTIFAQAVTIAAPTSLLLPETDPFGYPTINSNNSNRQINGKNIRYLVGVPAAQSFLGGKFDLTNEDSTVGLFQRDAYLNTIRSVVAEYAITDRLAVQLRYGHDARINQAPRASSTTIFAPGAPGNNYVDPATGQVGTQWAMNQSMTATPFWTGSRGYRAAIAYQKDLKRWGYHQMNVFHQDMDSWTNQQPWRFYELDANGNTIQNRANITNTESGRNVMPAVWMPIFPKSLIGGKDWPNYTVQHPNGKTYRFQPQIYAGAVPATPGNPMGLSGPISASTGNSSNTTYFMDDTRETSSGGSIFSEWWRGRIDTMFGLRREKASGYRNALGVTRPPNSYDSITAGAVADTPIRGLRVSGSYATNGKINFDTTRDIYNQILPSGEGVSRDIGLKLDLWRGRLSGNVNYYVSEGRNFIATLGGLQDDVDPNGINGRHGGAGYLYSITSNGYNASLNAQPTRGWEIRLNIATADGRERSDVTLPQFYNDQFNTTTASGQTVVGVKANATASVTPLMVPENPRDPSSAQVPLSIAMMKDPNSPYYAVLDPQSGQIMNAQSLGLLAPGVGTGVTGLPLTDHQLGFVSPSGGSLVVRRAGEKTVRYAEYAYSLVNRYRFSEGRLRGLVIGLDTTYQQNFRGYMYNDMLDGNRRKMFYLPDRFLTNMFAAYSFHTTPRLRPITLQLNVANLLDANRVLMLPSSTNGSFRYAQWFNSPRKFSLTVRVGF